MIYLKTQIMQKKSHLVSWGFSLLLIIGLVAFTGGAPVYALAETGAIEITLEGKELATASATLAPDAESINQAISERISKKLTEEQRKKVQETLSSLTQLRRAVSGAVERITAETLLIRSINGTISIPLTSEVLIKKEDKKIAASDVTLDDHVVALGAIQSGEVVQEDEATIQLEPHLILVLDEKTQHLRPIVIKGNIAALTKNQLEVTNRADGAVKRFALDNQTQFEDIDGKLAQASDFIEEVAVLVAGYDQDGNLRAGTIRSLAPLSELKGAEPTQVKR